MPKTTEPFSLIEIRKPLGLTQTGMAELMGLSLRAYSDLETGATNTRLIHVKAAERIALRIAVEKGDPMLAPATIRADALELARILRED